MDHAEYVGEFLSDMGFDFQSNLRSMLNESEEVALIEFYALRKSLELFKETCCPGYKDIFCCGKKRKEDELCGQCQEEVKEMEVQDGQESVSSYL